MRIRYLSILLAAAVVLACSGCQPQDAPATLCGDLPGSWFAEATGKTALKSSVEVRDGGAKDLPFRWDAEHPFVRSSIQCQVKDGDDEVAEFTADLKPTGDLKFEKSAVDKASADSRFKTAGGVGRVAVSDPPDPVADTYWYCGSSVLGLTLKKFASDDKAGLIRQLTERIADRVGCTQPFTPPASG